MAGLHYLDFDMLISRAGSGYRARVLHSPGGEAVASFTFPFADAALASFLSRLILHQDAKGAEVPESIIRDFGSQLFTAVFSDDVRASLHAGLDAAEGQGMGLRLRLRLAEAPELINLPWEFLYHPTLHRFLALSDRTPLVRYHELPEQIQPLGIHRPLRVLVMVSSPAGYPRLNTELEWSRLNAALADLQKQGQVAIERLETANLPALQRRLRGGEYHVFQYIGHGGFDEATQDGVLLLEDEAGNSQIASGRHLGTLLHDHRSLRLAVLNSCAGARTSLLDPFAGTAQSLVIQGVPAVIAMQFDISDRAAVTFAQEFYAAIAAAYAVDQALAEARKAILLTGSPWEWATPVLYMRAPDGRVFDIEANGIEQAAISPASVPGTARLTAQPAPPERSGARQVGSTAAELPAVDQRELVDLSEKLQRGRLILFIGGDLPETVTGLPSRQAIADSLAARAGITPGPGLASVAQQTMQAGSRYGFTDLIRTKLDTMGRSPRPFYQMAANLVLTHHLDTIITTAYDNLLELAFQQARAGLNVVIRPDDISFISPERPTLFKLLGDRNQPETLIVTEQDQHGLLRDWKNPIIGEIQSAMRRNSVLFLGYDLADPVVGALFDEIAGDKFQMRSYAVWSGLSPQQQDSLRGNRNLVVLEADPVDVLRALAQG